MARVMSAQVWGRPIAVEDVKGVCFGVVLAKVRIIFPIVVGK